MSRVTNLSSWNQAGAIPVWNTKCHVHLKVRIPHFQCGHRGSIPLRDTNFYVTFFCFLRLINKTKK